MKSQSLSGVALAANLQDAFGGEQLNNAASAAGYNPTATTTLLSTVGNLISVVLSLVGVIFLILIIYGGFSWMTAAGNETQAKSAKNIIARATAGAVVVLLAYAITYFVIKLLP